MANSADAILQQIRETQRAMVVELQTEVKKPTYGIKKPSLLMFGREGSMEGYWRFLSDCNWDMEEAIKLMKSAHDWHAKMDERVEEIKAAAFKSKPGLFSFRQVGFDMEGRPVLYGCFAQNSATVADWTVDACIAHFSHIAENAGRSCKQRSEDGGFQNQIVIDCHGFTSAPFHKAEFLIKLHQTMTLLYPDVIRGIFVVNYSQEVRNVWSSIKEHFDEAVQGKVKFVPPATVSDTFNSLFGTELYQWLVTELRANKAYPLPKEQKEFYVPHEKHDPRGTPIYVSTFLVPSHPDGHIPHPGITL